MSITFALVIQPNQPIILRIILLLCVFSFLPIDSAYAQSALEISLEQDINLRYSTHRKLIAKYESFLKDKKYSSTVDQAVLKVYLGFYYLVAQQDDKFKAVRSAASYPFNVQNNPLAAKRAILLQAIYSRKDKDFEKTQKLISNCLKKTRAAKYSTIRADAYYFAALLELQLNHSDSSKTLLMKVQSLAQKSNLPAQEALSIRKIGYLDQFIDGDLNLSKLNTLKSLKITEEHNLDIISAETSRALAGIYFSQGQGDSNIYYLKRAVAKFTKLEMPRGLVSSKISLAVSLLKSENLKEARQYLNEAEKLCIETDCRDLLPYVYINLKSTISADSVDQIIANYQKAIAIAKEYNNYLVVYHSGMNLGVAYGNNDRFLEAQKAYKASKKALVLLDSKSFTHVYNRSLIDFHNSWREDKPEEFKKFAQQINYEKVLSEAAVAFQKNNDLGELEYLYQTCVNYYRAIDLKKLSKYQDLLLKMKDSSNALKLAEANSNYLGDLRTAKKEKAIVKLKADNAIAELEKKQLLFGSTLALILLSLLGYYIYQRIKKRNAAEQSERALAMRHKLSNDLHDEVGSNLTGLVMMAEGISMSENPSKTSIDKLATLSRSTMVTMRDTVWAIDSRKDSVEDLVFRMIDFAQYLFDETDVILNINQDIEDGKQQLSSEVRQNIYLLFKEALGNAAKHSNGDEVSIYLKQSEKLFELKVHNNGTVENDIKTSGLGMQSMNERVDAFDGVFSIDTSDGFVVTAKFPI